MFDDEVLCKIFKQLVYYKLRASTLHSSMLDQIYKILDATIINQMQKVETELIRMHSDLKW